MADIRNLVTGFSAEMERIHSEMREAEQVAGMLGLAVPWKPESEKGTKGGYVSHKDGREVMLEILRSYSRGQSYHYRKLLTDANRRMSERGEHGYSEAAVQSWLRKFEAQGIVIRDGGGNFHLPVGGRF